jgi:uncharacterized damage-inducible protein DinB
VKIESPSFQPADIAAFHSEFVVIERDLLVDRLEAASAELGDLAARVEAIPGEEGRWSAQEILAHIVMLSKLYGMLTYKVGTGAMTEVDLAGHIAQRDVLGEQMAKLPAAELVAMALADHRRTAAYLRTATPEELARRVDLAQLGRMTAGEIARLPLVAHLEQHVRQLREALSPA